MSKTHFVDKYLMNPQHPITVAVIGTGGTGSYVVTQLAKICVALYELKGIMLHVVAYDDDKVEKHNCCRQLFSESDIGEYKSNVIISRVNRFYGLQWESHTQKIKTCPEANVIITCVDNVKTRQIIRKTSIRNNNKRTDYKTRIYWMDFGNSRDFGQYVLGTFSKLEQPKVSDTIGKLKNIFDIVPDVKDDPTEPSCSMAESLQQQDLFINLELAVKGCGLLWKLLKEHRIEYHGQFINQETGYVRPILIQ